MHAHMATSCSRQRRLESPKNSRRSQLLQCRSQTVATAVSVLLLWQLVAAQSPQIVPPTVAAAAAPFHPGERIDQHADRHDHRPAGAALAAPFHNITGTFRGDWIPQTVPKGVIDVASVFGSEQGVVIMQLISTSSAHPNVQHVDGEMVLRDGPYIGQANLAMKVAGVFVGAIGRLHAIAEPEQPLQLPLISPEAHTGSRNYRQALFNALRHWAHTGDGMLVQSHQITRISDGRGREYGEHKGLTHTCSFVMDLSVSTASSEDPDKRPILGGRSSSSSSRGSKGKMDTKSNGIVPYTVEESAAGQPLPAFPPTKGDDEKSPALRLNGTLTSSSCGVSLRIGAAETRIELYFSKAVHYSLMIAFVTFIQIALLVRQMESTSQPAAAALLSQFTVGHQALMDAYLCLLHLTTGIIVDPLFTAFAAAAFLEFMLFGIFEMRWLLIAWRAQQGSLLDAWQSHRQLSILYIRFYLLLLGAILMSWHLAQYVQWTLFPLCGWWLPQIAMSTWHDSRQPLKPQYVIGTSITRLALPLYLLACPHNLLRVAPSYGTAASLVVFVAAQAGLLIAQHKKGPRCWVPKRCLPPRYDYHRAVTPAVLPGYNTDQIAPATFQPVCSDGLYHGPLDEETGHAVECSICMTNVNIGSRSQRMITPCAHFFHSSCLIKWMDIKMICPVCRRALPRP